MARSALLAVGALVSAGVVVAFLSGSGGGELSFEDWQAEVTEICQEYEPRLAEAEGSHGEIRTIDEAVALFDTAIPILREYHRAFASVGVPSVRSDDVEELLDSLEIEERRVVEIRQALIARDMERYRRLVAVQAPAYEYLNSQASDLGVPACDSRGGAATRA